MPRARGLLRNLPEVFDLDDDGDTAVTAREVPAEHRAAVRCAAAACPERAILVD